MRSQNEWPTSFSSLASGVSGSASSTWMRSSEAAQYLGWSRSALHNRVSRSAMPHYKVDGILLFRRDELDGWLEQYREEPREHETFRVPQVSVGVPQSSCGCAPARDC